MQVTAMAVLLALYVVAAEMSLQLSLVGRSVTPVWPPTGIAVAAMVMFGLRLWPAVAAAAFIVNLPISPTPQVAAAIAAGNTLAPIAATLLLRWVRFRPQLDRTRDALALVFLAALGAMTISATVGTLALDAGGALGPQRFWPTWSVWWTGDAMGVLAVAPVLLIMASRRLRVRRVAPRRVTEAVALALMVAVAVGATVRVGRPLWVAAFPVLGWASWRFRQAAAAPAAFVVIVFASWAAARDLGPLAGAPLLEKMLALQVFNASVALMSFFFAAVVEDRMRLVAAERETQAALYRREHRIAEVLQRSLLPERLPGAPDIEVAARYIPSTADVEVGGDWYDMIPLADGRFGLVIGDVAGHGVGAAAAMGQMRMALRAYALEDLRPHEILGRLNTLLHEFQPGAMATLVYAEMDPEDGGVVVARAGHPPPFVVSAHGTVSELAGIVAPPLGASPLTTYVEASTTIPLGATVFLYTDGLIERRGESLDVGLERLRRALEEAPDDIELTCDAVLRRMLEDAPPADDTAVLAVRRISLAGRPLRLRIPAMPGRLAPSRRVLARWLRQNAIDERVAEEILLASGEACTNAVQHAYGSVEGWLELDADCDADEVTVRVRDTGKWKDPVGDHDERGRGLLLMQGLMDRVDVLRSGNGTEVRLHRRRAPAGGR